MEGLQRRSRAELSWQREFFDSRLEEQILRRAFELVIPILVQEAKQSELCNSDAARLPANATRSQGA